jgi:hypothetical protein
MSFTFDPTPFALQNPATFPRHQWLFGRHYMRKFMKGVAEFAFGGWFRIF